MEGPYKNGEKFSQRRQIPPVTVITDSRTRKIIVTIASIGVVGKMIVENIYLEWAYEYMNDMDYMVVETEKFSPRNKTCIVFCINRLLHKKFLLTNQNDIKHLSLAERQQKKYAILQQSLSRIQRCVCPTE
jgi:hypothetical protein